MVRTFVDSSDLRSVGYANTVLEIEFNSGGIYQYFDVPYQVYIALISAPSHGKYFHQYIKNHYAYIKVA